MSTGATDNQNTQINENVGGWNFDNTYSRLPETLFAKILPTPVANPHMVIFNRKLSDDLGLNFEALGGETGANIFSGNELPPGSHPLAQAYAGHQFGHFTMLGDGRAHLLGEQVTPKGKRLDIQLKGSGPTPFSRRGDGRAALGPMLREYLMGEAMHALGIPTSRGLAVVSTGESVFRETKLSGAILTRVASSHIRVGTFEYLAALGDQTVLKKLADYTIDRHYPELRESVNPYLELLSSAMDRQSHLVAQWLGVGFIHGVMNTDNVFLSGETLDYGPCAFMDTYNSKTVFSSIDRGGRYAYGSQPQITFWNMQRLAEALFSLIDESPSRSLELARERLDQFPQVFKRNWLQVMAPKVGIKNPREDDAVLIQSLLNLMEEHTADYTNTFRALCDETLPETNIFKEPEFLKWKSQWGIRLREEQQATVEARALMRKHNPSLIPRNHQVEKALTSATEDRDLALLQRLIAALEKPFDSRSEFEDLQHPPEPSSRVYQTFCGT